MIIHSITINNFRPFKVLQDVNLGRFATIVGKNDAGKSSILYAIQLFLDKKPAVTLEDFHDSSKSNEDIIIEVAFTSLPDVIQIETGVDTTLKDELLLDAEGFLRIKKIFMRDCKTVKIFLITQNFKDPDFCDLVKLKETDLNRKCKEKNIDVTKSGRGRTNKEKREKLRDWATRNGIPTARHELELSTKDELWKTIETFLPDFDLFEAEHETDVEATSFQSEFRPLIKDAANLPDIAKVKSEFSDTIEKTLQKEIEKIFEKLKKYTDDITGLTAKATFSWEKATTLQVYGKDSCGIDKSLEKRGSGIRRLFMVAFFEHLVEKREEKAANYIFGLEEPETSLHPGMQRDLAKSLKQLVDQGYQIIITTHSPVFVGASAIEDLTFITRKAGLAEATQYPKLDLYQIADDLEVEPADQIIGYKACVFVEGPDDIFFWEKVVSKFKAAGYVSSDFADKGIGLIPIGGSNLKCWMNMGAMKKLNRNFAVIIDSDRESQDHPICKSKLNFQKRCEEDGGLFIIFRKREMENYLHRNAIQRSGRSVQPCDDFSDMKTLFGENVFKVVDDMSINEILEMDKYVENDIEHHELREIIEKLLRIEQAFPSNS